MRQFLRFILMVPALSVLMSASSYEFLARSQPPPAPPARQVPGVNAADAFPNGCVDCHINLPDMQVDARFGTLMARLAAGVDPALLAKAQAASPEGLTLKGKHPVLPAGLLKNVPNGCLTCHGKTSKTAPSFVRLLHTLHLSGGQDNPFMTIYQAECTHCHKLDLKTGVWSIPSGPEK